MSDETYISALTVISRKRTQKQKHIPRIYGWRLACLTCVLWWYTWYTLWAICVSSREQEPQAWLTSYSSLLCSGSRLIKARANEFAVSFYECTQACILSYIANDKIFRTRSYLKLILMHKMKLFQFRWLKIRLSLYIII